MTATNFEVILFTPKGMILDTTTHMVIAPGVDGYFGVLSMHSPTITLLKPGLLEVSIDHNITMKYVISHGIARISNNKYSLIVEDAMALNNINLDVINNLILQVKAQQQNATSTLSSNKITKRLDFLNACLEIKKANI